MTGDVIAVGLVFLAFVVAAWWLRPAAALCVSVSVGVLQIFVTDHLSVSIAALWQIAAWLTVFRARARVPRLRGVGVAYIALILLSCLVLIWSPDRSAGLTLIAQLIGLGSTVALALVCASRDDGAMRAAFGLFAALVLVSAASTVLFRVVPAIEHQFFTSAAFGVLDSHEIAVHFFTTQRNNALDDAKSGGLFFVNANAASLFHGAAAAVLASRAVRGGGLERVLLAIVALVAFVAAILTGSKTAVYIGFAACAILAVVVIVLWVRRSDRFRGVLLFAACLAGAGLVILLPVAADRLAQVAADPIAQPAAAQQSADAKAGPSVEPQTHATSDAPAAESTTPDLAERSADALDTRVQIWGVGLALFEQRPFGVLGFGGWHVEYAPRARHSGLDPSLPPHNWLLDAWSQTGLPGLALELFIVVMIAWLAVGSFRRADRRRRMALCLAAIGIGWVLVHGLADNTGFYGGPRLIPVVALLLGQFIPATTGAAVRGASELDEARGRR